MVRGLPLPFEGKGAPGKKVKSDRGEVTESDPLLAPNPGARAIQTSFSGTFRARRSSRSPNTANFPMDSSQSSRQQGLGDVHGNHRSSDGYTAYKEDASRTSSASYAGESTTVSTKPQGVAVSSLQQSDAATPDRHERKAGIYRPNPITETPQQRGGGHPPLLEIPEEVYAVRKAALQVLKPLTSSWLVVSVGFAITILLGMSRWTQLLPDLPYWFVLLPSWFSHAGLLWCHVRSAQALSRFIAQANENRQRPDSTDHVDRTEYLPLLQRSLKFGLKTGLLSFCTFLLEVLVYIRIADGKMPIGVCFVPMWLLVVGGVLDGIICKTQSFIRLLCWILILATMIMATMRIDYGFRDLEWQIVVSPVVAVLSLGSLALLYIIYGHQVGYYRLTESQLTAGILYSMSAIIAIVLVVVVAEVMPLSRPVEIETRILVVVLAPLVVCLTGMGAYAVSRDEFGRLLLYGGQAAVHPMRLKWDSKGWTSVPTKGVVIIPMFGEVSYRPLERSQVPDGNHFCRCISCYPYEVEDDTSVDYPDGSQWHDHPYLAPRAENILGRAV